eukprot:298760-Pleurochrysis_carterae.AAC.3
MPSACDGSKVASARETQAAEEEPMLAKVQRAILERRVRKACSNRPCECKANWRALTACNGPYGRAPRVARACAHQRLFGGELGGDDDVLLQHAHGRVDAAEPAGGLRRHEPLTLRAEGHAPRKPHSAIER